MIILVALTEMILYTAFSILMGSLILLSVPEGSKPPVYISKKILYLAVVFIPLAAFFPVIRTAEIFSDQNLWFMLKNVLFTFEVGKAWVFMLIISTVLIRIMISKEFLANQYLQMLALLLTLLMLIAYTYSSHAASITDWQGFVYHTLHFLAVTIWIGILLMVSWFAKSKENWLRFLRWFTPIAIICLITATVAGFFTMGIDINSYDDPTASIWQEYQNSLVVNYGQALLFKHIFFISLVAFAIINGILFRKKSNQNSFNPLKWARLESVYALVVFGLTAFMGQSWPPHQIYNLVKSYGASPLYTSLTNGELVEKIQRAEGKQLFNVTIAFEPLSYVLMVLGGLFLIISVVAAIKKSSILISSISTLLMVLSVYFAVMGGVQ